MPPGGYTIPMTNTNVYYWGLQGFFALTEEYGQVQAERK